MVHHISCPQSWPCCCSLVHRAGYAVVVSSPDPTLSQGKGSGDYWALPWLCQVSNLDFWISEWLCLYDVALFHWLASTLVWLCAISLACSESILLTRHNQESAQWSPDPFSRERVGVLGTRLMLLWFARGVNRLINNWVLKFSFLETIQLCASSLF